MATDTISHTGDKAVGMTRDGMEKVSQLTQSCCWSGTWHVLFSQYCLLSLGSGFLPEPALSFEDPPSFSSAASPSIRVTQPSEAPSPIVAVFGSGSSMVTTVMNEHPPTLPPASTKPQVTPAKPKCLLKAASVLSLSMISVGWGVGSRNGPHYCRYPAANLLAHLGNDALYNMNLKSAASEKKYPPADQAHRPV